jgi:Icc protein
MKQKYCKSLLKIFVMVVFSCFFWTDVYCQDLQYQRLVIISDLHYPCKYLKVKDAQTRDDIVKAKQQALQEINSWNDVAEVVFTGDLVGHSGSATEDAAAKQFLSGLHHPRTCLVGNHDYLYQDVTAAKKVIAGDINSRSEKLARFKEVYGCKDLYFSKRVGAYLLVYLATDRLDTKFACEMSRKQVEWFREVLCANRKVPTIVFFHAPLANTLSKFISPEDIAQPEQDIETILCSNPQVFLWVSGHTHTNPGNPDFNAKVNYYEGRVLDVYNGTWDTLPVCTNSLYLYPDKVVIRTFNHETHQWLGIYDRTVSLPRL